MAMAVKTRNLSPSEAAYIAGLIDGEGTIALARKHARDNRQLVITISSTESTILGFVIETVGVGKITRKRRTHDHHRPGLTYAITNRQALQLLAQVHPFLRSYKRERSALILSSYLALTPRNGKYNDAMKTERALFETQFMSITAPKHDGTRAAQGVAKG